jgi:AcrR family transcriptional regulator
MVRSDRKQREFERREQEILDAALALCAKPDWESISVDQIASLAGIGKGTVYQHFSSKDELLFRLMIRFYTGLLIELQQQEFAGSASEQFRAILSYSLQYHLDHTEYRYIVLYCERVDFKERAAAHWRDDFLALDRSFESWGRPLIEQAMAHGEFVQRSPESVMLGLHAAFKGSVTLLWSGGDWCPAYTEPHLLIEAATNFMVSGLVGHE